MILINNQSKQDKHNTANKSNVNFTVFIFVISDIYYILIYT